MQCRNLVSHTASICRELNTGLITLSYLVSFFVKCFSHSFNDFFILSIWCHAKVSWWNNKMYKNVCVTCFLASCIERYVISMLKTKSNYIHFFGVVWGIFPFFSSSLLLVTIIVPRIVVDGDSYQNSITFNFITFYVFHFVHFGGI